MSLSDIESEDFALLASLVIATVAVLVDELYGGTLFKALKILSLILSIGLAIHRIKSGKPFFKDIADKDWVDAGEMFEVVVPKSIHKRGKFPHPRCLVPNGYGSYAECFIDGDVQPDGSIIVRAKKPVHIRLEVRK